MASPRLRDVCEEARGHTTGLRSGQGMTSDTLDFFLFLKLKMGMNKQGQVPLFRAPDHAWHPQSYTHTSATMPNPKPDHQSNLP